MLWLRDTKGDQAPIIATEIAITETQGSFDALTFNFFANHEDPTDKNLIASEMMVPRTIVTEPETGKEFRILQVNPVSVGSKQQFTVTCTGISYDLHGYYVEGTLTGSQSLNNCMDLITKNTSFSFQLAGSFGNHSYIDTLGGGYADELLTTLATDFGFEYYFDNYVIHIAKTIGTSGTFLFLDGNNASKLSYNEDYSTITTHIKGYGKQNDDGTYTATAEYSSPLMASPYNWGRLDAEPYSADEVTDNGVLLTALKQQIHDYPDVQYSMDYVSFTKNVTGFKNDTTPGNQGWIRDRFGIDVSVRVQSRTYYPQAHDSAQAGSITFGNKIFDSAVYLNKMLSANNQNLKLGKTLTKKVQTASDTAQLAYNSRIYGEKVGDSDY